MPGQMPEQIAAQVAGHCNEGVAGDPARNAPKEVVGRNQRRQEHETEPRVFRMGGKPLASVSTRTFTPYWAPTEQATAATTAVTMAAWASGRRLT